MKISNTTITFRIDIDFEDCDVDMVYNEMRARGVSTPVPSLIVDYEAKGGFGKKPDKFKLKGNKTPTEASVDFALSWVTGYVDPERMCTQSQRYWSIKERKNPLTELEQIGIDVSSWYGLMMGTCHLNCEVDYKIFSPELVSKANEIVFNIFKKYVKYYKNKKVA